jgi:hypothetical protein
MVPATIVTGKFIHDLDNSGSRTSWLLIKIGGELMVENLDWFMTWLEKKLSQNLLIFFKKIILKWYYFYFFYKIKN